MCQSMEHQPCQATPPRPNKAGWRKRLFAQYLRLRKELYYRKWALDLHFLRNVSLPIPEKATVIIPNYNAARARNLQPLTRSILKCDFVERLIVSNHNPAIRLRDWVKPMDARLELIDQPVRRGCGYRWIVARQQDADYLIVIDDDMLLYPRQIAVLFQRLVEQPEIPHGLVGCRCDGKYVRRQEAEVDNLFNVYAVTRTHVARYLEYVAEILAHGYASPESIEYWADDIIMSRAGTDRPRIHDAGPVLQCKTSDAVGVATFQEEQFEKHRTAVRGALQQLAPKPAWGGRSGREMEGDCEAPTERA